jgi:soluble lytic murein transglycosylase-like protein
VEYLDRMKQVQQIVSQVGKATGVDPALGMAVAKAESSFNPKAVSSDGHESKGLFQLLDTTGKELHEETGAERRYDPFDPTLNANLGVRYLRRLHDIFSQTTKLPNDLESVSAANSSSLEKLAVAAFNAGEGRVAAAQARAKEAGLNPGLYEEVERYLPKTTQEYVSRVMQYKGQFGTDSVG